MKDNTLRLRLSQTEVEQFGKEGKVSTDTRLGTRPEAVLRYSLVKDEKAEMVKTTFAGNEICVHVPKHLAEDWASTERVGFEENLQLNGNEYLYVLVEKDFQCLHKSPNEDETDSFSFPNFKGETAGQKA